jgi:hypothetical protein
MSEDNYIDKNSGMGQNPGISWSNDGHDMVIPSGKNIYTYDLADGTLALRYTASFDQTDSAIESVGYSDAGKYVCFVILAGSGPDNPTETLWAFDLATGQAQKQPVGNDVSLLGNSGYKAFGR